MDVSNSLSHHQLDFRALGPQAHDGTRLRDELGFSLPLLHDLLTKPQGKPDEEDSDVEIIEIPPPQKGKRGAKRARAATKTRGRKRAKVVESDSEVEEIDPPAEIVKEEFFAFSHTFEFECVKGRSRDRGVSKAQAEGYGWPQHEAEFLDALTTHLGSVNEPGSISVEEPINLHLNRASCQVAAFKSDKWHTSNAILTLPPLVQEHFDIAEFDFTSQKLHNVMYAVMELVGAGRAKVDARLIIHFTPPDPMDAQLPYRIQLKVDVHLIAPDIFQPFMDVGTPLGEAQRRLWFYLYDDHFDSPADFQTDISRFYSCLRPAPLVGSHLQSQIQPEGLSSTLLPFQRRSVQWMLRREGKEVTPNGTIKDFRDDDAAPLFWMKVPAKSKTQSGKERESWWWLNVLTGAAMAERPHQDDVVGGLLAEEPGLGKTVESISLVLYKTPSRSELGPSLWSSAAEVEVTPIKGTLIVTPVTLLKQWADELERHAGGLRVLIYDGWNSPSIRKIIARSSASHAAYVAALNEHGEEVKEPAPSRGKRGKAKGKGKKREVEEEDDEENMDWKTFAGRYDVVLTTYNTLQKDLTVARPPVRRPRREVAVYQPTQEKFRSPLVLVEWERVLMDEVQMVGGGKTAEMVSLIPRRSSFAVSGTPAKSHVQDLIAPLRFLGLNLTTKAWNRVLHSGFYSTFVSIFDRYAIRTPKSEADGLAIPKQTRYAMPISLGMIERHFYDQTLENALLELGLDFRGVARWPDWELNAAMLRSAIRRLRMACIHPQVGALGGGPKTLGGAVRPIADVLSNMVDQNWQTLMTDKKSLINARIQVALLEQRTQDVNRHKKSLESMLVIRNDVLALIDELNEALTAHDAKGKLLIKAADEDEHGLRDDTPSDPKGKGKEKENAKESASPNPELLPASAEGDEHRHTRLGLLARLREVQVCLHRTEFCLGDLYHHFGRSAEEEDSYGKAETLRRTLLKTTEEGANKSIARLNIDILVNGVKDKQLRLQRASKPGIKSEKYFEEENGIMDVLDEQRVLIFKWRTHIYNLLTRKIVSEGEDADGQEYQRALDDQGEIECYMKAYADLLADRREVLNQERTALAAHDGRERRLRHTKAAARAAAAFDEGKALGAEMPEFLEEVEDPELTKELKTLRKDCRDGHPANRALKSVMSDLARLDGNDMEQAIAREEAKRLRGIIHEQTTLVDKLSNEMAPLRTTFNGRIAYFKQLQELSDSVAEIELKEQTLAEGIQESTEQIAKYQDSIRTKGARQRFLQYIAKKSAAPEEMDEEDKECGICNCDFDTGFLLACGHIFCDDCLKLWRKKGEGVGTRCATCREQIDNDSLHRITFARTAEEQAQILRDEEQGAGDRALKAIKYNTVPAEMLEAMAKVESYGNQYGAKIQTLVRQVLMVEEMDPGSQSIVFSAWADSLHIIEHALTANGISCIRIDAKTGKRNAAHMFQTDPSIRVLLLHGERENSGLNLTCAKRVILVEPTVNISFELQAIARVDRLGQQSETEVYCYYATDTVEQNILDNAVRRGTSLYTVGNTDPVNLAAAAVVEQQQVEGVTRDKTILKGDFIAGSEQMLEVLFPDLFVDVERDLDLQDVVMTDAAAEDDREPLPSIAGPSSSRY